MPKNMSVTDRWWQKVDCRGPADCWPWIASRDSDGYGRFQEPTPLGQRHVRAHVWIMEHLHGPIHPSLVVMHSCDNPGCVNPAHLDFGTPRDNNDDKVRKGRHARVWGQPLKRARQTLCSAGHPFDAENTYIDPKRGHRQCKTCRRINARRYYHQKAS